MYHVVTQCRDDRKLKQGRRRLQRKRRKTKWMGHPKSCPLSTVQSGQIGI